MHHFHQKLHVSGNFVSGSKTSKLIEGIAPAGNNVQQRVSSMNYFTSITATYMEAIEILPMSFFRFTLFFFNRPDIVSFCFFYFQFNLFLDRQQNMKTEIAKQWNILTGSSISFLLR